MSQMLLDAARRTELVNGFQAAFGALPERFFSAPGRTELGGNPGDGGRVLAAAVELDMVAAVRVTGSGAIRVQFRDEPMCLVELMKLDPVPEEAHTLGALVRGAAAWFRAKGCSLTGCDLYVTSRVPLGSGLASSAAFGVLLGVTLNSLLFEGRCTPRDMALAAQAAESRYQGERTGLIGPMTSALGGFVAMDFENPDKPLVKKLRFDFSDCGYELCMVNTGARQEELCREYASIPREMGEICGYFDKEHLGEVAPMEFFTALPTLRDRFGDRAVLRVIHFFREDSRVEKQTEALEAGDFEAFLRQVRLSGDSAYMCLQNVVPAGAVKQQPMAVALALCEHYLAGRGACRVHECGCAGTVQAFVPQNRLEAFLSGMEDALGKGSCRLLTFRETGAVELL